MKFPKRTSSHLKETASWKVLESKAPESWIVREATERDYGIDAYVEITAENGDVSGDLFTLQLKATDRIKWNKGERGAREASVPGVKLATVNYWMHGPCPAFLVYADLNANRAYFASVKAQVRQQYDAYRKQKRVSLTVAEPIELGTELGDLMFTALYHKEKQFPQFREALYGLMLHWEEYFEFIQSYQCRDDFLDIEPCEQVMLFHLYRSCFIAAHNLGVEWKVPDLAEVYSKDIAAWKSKDCMLHQHSMAEVMKPLEKVFSIIMRKAKALMADSPFWCNAEPALSLAWQFVRLDKLSAT